MSTDQHTVSRGAAKRIQQQRTKGWRMPKTAVRVSRPSIFGNPFPVDRFGRDLAVDLFDDMARGLWNPSRIAGLSAEDAAYAYAASRAWRARVGGHPLEAIRAALSGHDLACWCPLLDEHGQRVRCHADVLLHLANGPR